MAAALGLALTCAAFWPGWASSDSLQQYLTATGRLRLDDVHPPLMAGLWHLTDAMVPGSGGLFLLFATAWWGGLAACAWALFERPWQRWLATALVGLWPAAFLLLAHVWKDVGMAAALLVAVAATLRWQGGGTRWSGAIALLALVAACGFRHNGVFAAWPLLVWLCWPGANAAARVRWRVGAVVLLSLVLVATPATIARLSGAARGDAWTVVALWDIGAISVAQDRMLMPASLVMPDLTVDELRAGYLPYANPPIFGSGKLLLSLFVPYTDAQRAALREAWWNAVRRHPRDYLAHRTALAWHLLLGYDAALPYQLVYVPERLVDIDTQPRLAPLPPDDLGARAARRLWTTPLFAGALYLALASFAIAGALRASRRAVRAPVFALSASAFGNALPLLAIAGSAEFRYLAWSVVAALLAVLAAWLAQQRRPVVLH
ncbi:hypothetical protein [Chiayiivirga flava]|uniref:Glycosyltransferase RgtA/B/C/D-like domain-containing protein n=1 Tax=Chiayiivirga flava TaxID=659595 RepID=A0A7W8G0H6_9GAMM|nr:hypothetical protein [Chiayiivirga flava]MBB5207758.1 hypothetical protein [Chiayiivirga flava]